MQDASVILLHGQEFLARCKTKMKESFNIRSDGDVNEVFGIHQWR